MAIPRVKINGQWEPITALHATMADSANNALYDDKGNIISSTYISNTALSEALSQLMLTMNPIGTIKFTADNVNPGTYIGGTWVPWGSGRVPVGVDTTDTDFDTAEETGGSKTNDLSHSHSGTGNTGSTAITTAQIPAHTHGEKALIGSFRTSDNIVKNTATSPTVVSGSGIVATSASTSAHNVCNHSGAVVTANQKPTDVVTITATHTHDSVGDGGGHTHTMGSVASKELTGSTIQPYITCYMWKRTA